MKNYLQNNNNITLNSYSPLKRLIKSSYIETMTYALLFIILGQILHDYKNPIPEIFLDIFNQTVKLDLEIEYLSKKIATENFLGDERKIIEDHLYKIEKRLENLGVFLDNLHDIYERRIQTLLREQRLLRRVDNIKDFILFISDQKDKLEELKSQLKDK